MKISLAGAVPTSLIITFALPTQSPPLSPTWTESQAAGGPGVRGAVVFPQENMRSALNEGQSILESIREPLVKSPEQSLNQDQLDNQTTVQR